MINPLENKLIRLILIVLTILSVLIPMIRSYYGAIYVDSAVILTEMERIYEGYVPYKTLHLNYPPLWFYMMVILKWIFQIPYGCYEFYLTIHYLFSVGCAVCVYGISKQFGAKRSVNLFSAWLFLITMHWLSGDCVLFEMPSLLFGLSACFLALKLCDKSDVHYVYVGVLSCGSFLCKQFGAGFLLLTIYLIVYFCEYKSKKVLYYLVGYSIPLLVCFLIFGKDMYISILLNGYGTTTMELAGWDCSFFGKIKIICGNIYHFSVKIIPLVSLSILFIPFIIKQNKYKEYFFCICGICGFALQYYLVPQALHYYQYMVPFGILIIPILSVISENKMMFFKSTIYLIILSTALVSCYNVHRRRVYRNCYWSYLEKKSQKAIADEINQLDLSSKTIWVAHTGLQQYNYLCNLYPANIKEIGYAVGPLEVTKEKALKQLESSDYVLHFAVGNDLDYYYNGEVSDYIACFPADTIGLDGNILLRKLK